MIKYEKCVFLVVIVLFFMVCVYSILNETFSLENDGLQFGYEIVGENYLKFEESVGVINDNLFLISDMNIDELITKINSNGNLSVYNVEGMLVETGKIKTGDRLVIDFTDERLEYKISIVGEITGDGVIDNNDVIALSRYLLIENIFDDEYLYACDIDFNGVINVNDVIKLFRYLDGKYIINIDKNYGKDVLGISFDEQSGEMYLNSTENELVLSYNIYPSTAINKNVIWSSSDDNVATVNSDGVVIAKNLGSVDIIATTEDGGYNATYKLSVKEKVIIVITASQGVRMNDWLKEFTSLKNNTYSIKNKTLKYIYESGSGFDFQIGEGTDLAIEFINNNFKLYKDYVEVSVFFTMTGNSVRLSTCDEIVESDEYESIAYNYNEAVNSMKIGGYKIDGYVVSHAPLQSKHANASNKHIVYSTDSRACDAGYRSGWKYYLSNEKIKMVLEDYPQLTFVDNFSNFIIVSDSENRKFTWLRDYTTTDALHWDESTTIDYMTVLFNEVGM